MRLFVCVKSALVTAKLLMDVCAYETLPIPILNCLLLQLRAHLALQWNYHYSVTRSCCWLLPLNKSHDITQQRADCTKNEWHCGLITKSSLSLLPNTFWLHVLHWYQVHAQVCSALEKQLLKEPITELPMWWTDSAVLNYAILVLPLFMLFTLQAKSTPKWRYD